MASMTIRTTVAFDPATVARWERLAKLWGVSKSEALRRALKQAEFTARAANPDSGPIPEFSAMSPPQILEWLKTNPQTPIPGGWGDDACRDIREMREHDAKIEDERSQARSKVADDAHPYRT